MRSQDFSIDPILSAALGSIQSWTKISTRNLPWGKGRPARKADLAAIWEPITSKMWKHRSLTTPGPPRFVTGIALPFFFYLFYVWNFMHLVTMCKMFGAMFWKIFLNEMILESFFYVSSSLLLIWTQSLLFSNRKVFSQKSNRPNTGKADRCLKASLVKETDFSPVSPLLSLTEGADYVLVQQAALVNLSTLWP
jgi:hypothetical protein